MKYAPEKARIVACVNACEGIPTEALEAGAIKKVIEALETLEWRLFDATAMKRCCIACHRNQDRGHEDDCLIGNALAAIRGESVRNA